MGSHMNKLKAHVQRSQSGPKSQGRPRQTRKNKITVRLLGKNVDMGRRRKRVVTGNTQRGIPKTKQTQRWRLISSPTKHNDCPKLELPGAWEPPCKHYTLSLGEGKSFQSFVSHGYKTNSGRDEEDSSKLAL